MTKFKEGNTYVDDKTGAVYECAIAHESHPYGAKLRRISASDKDYAAIIANDLRGTDDFQLRPWQASDEPASYDVKRWGKVDIGKVYKACLNDADYIIKVGSLYNDCVGFKYINDGAVTFEMSNLHFESSIARPAFPHEVERLDLPQMEGTLRWLR